MRPGQDGTRWNVGGGRAPHSGPESARIDHPTPAGSAQKGCESRLDCSRTRLMVLGRESGRLRAANGHRAREGARSVRISRGAGSATPPSRYGSARHAWTTGAREFVRRFSRPVGIPEQGAGDLPVWREIRNELRHQPLADRVRDGVGPVPELEPRRDVMDDVLDRPLGVEELPTHLGGVVALGEQPQDRCLPLGQARERQPPRRQHLALELPRPGAAAGPAGRARASPRRPPRTGSPRPCCRPSPRSGG